MSSRGVWNVDLTGSPTALSSVVVVLRVSGGFGPAATSRGAYPSTAVVYLRAGPQSGALSHGVDLVTFLRPDPSMFIT